jgi:ATP synthase F1 complex assembly factor 2
MNNIILQRVPALKDSIRQVYRRYCGDPPTLNAATAKDFANRGVHLTGRNRFYKFVGVKRVDPPWDSKEVVLTVDSPISAGVDNTQSATGVHTSLATDVVKKQRLMPRKPGSTRTNDPVNWYGVTLDGKIVKTPLGQTLAVPSETLAWAIAAEWDAQERRLRPAQMPLMTLVCTALDQTTAAPEVAQANSLTYLPTDTICYWADPVEDRLLHRKQHEAWDSIHNYCDTSVGARAAVAVGANEGLLLSRVQGLKSIGLPHPAKIVNGAQQFVQSLDAWHLTALSVVASEAKSFLAAAALLSGSLNPKDAVEAARIEEEFQISIWGMVEGQHDYDRLNCSIQMHAAHMLISSIAIDNNNL